MAHIIKSDLLEQVTALNVNLSAMAEAAFDDDLACTNREQWLNANAQAMSDYNEFVDRHGVFSDGLRSFTCPCSNSPK